MGIKEEKKAIRQEMRKMRSETTESQMIESAMIISQLRSDEKWKNAKTILVYAALPGEVNTDTLLQSEGKRIVLPVVEGDHLILREYDKDNLNSGYMGIAEPSEKAKAVCADEIELAIIPGVAFDKDGHRLGRGKGYYDKLLPQLKCPTIGLAFSWQMIGLVPTEQHDVTLTEIISPLPLL